MTTVTFHSAGGRLDGFMVAGHSEYAEEGSDIVCAGITGAVTLAECAVNDVLGLGAAVKVDQARAAISLKLPGGLSEENERACQTLMVALMLYFTHLKEEYPEHIIVLEDESQGDYPPIS